MAIIEERLERAKSESIDSYSVALIHAGLGDAENALLFIEKAAETGGIPSDVEHRLRAALQ